MAFSLALGVTTEGLRSKAGEVSADVEKMIFDTQKMMDQIGEMSYYWKGEAASALYRKCDSNLSEINSVLVRLRTYPMRILTMAGIYETAEETSEDIAAGLKTDIEMR